MSKSFLPHNVNRPTFSAKYKTYSAFFTSANTRPNNYVHGVVIIEAVSSESYFGLTPFVTQ